MKLTKRNKTIRIKPKGNNFLFISHNKHKAFINNSPETVKIIARLLFKGFEIKE